MLVKGVSLKINCIAMCFFSLADCADLNKFYKITLRKTKKPLSLCNFAPLQLYNPIISIPLLKFLISLSNKKEKNEGLYC